MYISMFQSLCGCLCVCRCLYMSVYVCCHLRTDGPDCTVIANIINKTCLKTLLLLQGRSLKLENEIWICC